MRRFFAPAVVITMTVTTATAARAETATAAGAPVSEAPTHLADRAGPRPTDPVQPTPAAVANPFTAVPAAAQPSEASEAPRPMKAVAGPTVARPLPPAVPVASAPSSTPVAQAPAPVVSPAATLAATTKEAERAPAVPSHAALPAASEAVATPWDWKLLVAAAIVGVVILLGRKRSSLATAARDGTAPLQILRQTSLGLRGDLAVVRVGGKHLLVGLSPFNMQTLAVLSDEEATLMAVQGVVPPVDAGAAQPIDERSSTKSRDVVELTSKRGPRLRAANKTSHERTRERETIPPPGERETDRRSRPVRKQPVEEHAEGIVVAIGNRR
jgi:flagellar biogenesis protein FliO